MLDDPRLDIDRSARPAGWCSARGRSTTTSSATRPRRATEGVAVARLEQLYPFPVDRLRRAARRATRTSRRSSGRRRSRRTWAPGARSATASRRGCPPASTLRYVGRPWRASPSEGYPTAHLRRAGPDRARGARRLLESGLHRPTAGVASLRSRHGRWSNPNPTPRRPPGSRSRWTESRSRRSRSSSSSRPESTRPELDAALPDPKRRHAAVEEASRASGPRPPSR